MKPKHPKRLYFRKVRRVKVRPLPRLLVHRGNAPAGTSGCILLGPEVQVQLIDKTGTVLQQFTAALVQLATGMQRAARALGAALAPVATYQAQLQLRPAEAAWLRALAG